MTDLSGILLLDKPRGPSSFKTLSGLKKIFPKTRLGFAGTLDPAASGLLLVGVGKATRCLQYLEGLPKSYTFDVIPGLISDTYDLEGEVTRKVEEESIQVSKSQLESILKQFQGSISQTPPVYSALKINGKRACDRARAGETVVLNPRTVHLYSIEIIRFEPLRWTIKIFCSKGTYVRSIAHDIGAILGCGAVADNIYRNSIGDFQIENAYRPEDVSVETPLLPLEIAFTHFPKLSLEPQGTADFRHGRTVNLLEPLATEEEVAVFNSEKIFLGLGTTEFPNLLQPTRVFNPA